MTVTHQATATVLLVEDDRDVIDLVEAVIARGPTPLRIVGACRNGAEALSVAAMLQPDVVLLDLGLPDGGGLSVLTQLPVLCPATAIVVHSAYVDLYAAHLGHVDDVINKGPGILNLPRRLLEAAARRSV